MLLPRSAPTSRNVRGRVQKWQRSERGRRVRPLVCSGEVGCVMRAGVEGNFVGRVNT